MPILTTFIPHSTGSPSQNSYARKINKNIQIGKKEVKLSLFTENMILYIENPKDTTKNI